MIESIGSLPVFDLTDIRKYVQNCAKEQWKDLRPERLVCTGLVGLPPKNDARQIIEWYTCMRTNFDLAEMPETFIIRIPSPESLILISSSTPTYADA